MSDNETANPAENAKAIDVTVVDVDHLPLVETAEDAGAAEMADTRNTGAGPAIAAHSKDAVTNGASGQNKAAANVKKGPSGTTSEFE